MFELSKPDTRSLRDRIGSRHAISFLGMVVMLILGAILLIVREGAYGYENANNSSLPWLLAALGASIAPSGLAYLAYRFIYRNRVNPVPLWVTPSLYAFLGLTYSLGIILFSTALGLESVFAWYQRLLAWSTIGSLWGTAQAWFSDMKAQSHLLREQLIEEAVKVDMTRISQDELISVFEKEVLPQVQNALSGARRAVFATGDDGTPAYSSINARMVDTGQISRVLISTADEAIRPLSAKLREAQEVVYPRDPDRLTVFRNLVDKEFFLTWIIVPIYIAVNAQSLFRTFGLWPAVYIILFTSVTVGAGFELMNFLMRLFPRYHRSFFILGLLINAIVNIALIPIRNSFLEGTGNLEAALWQILGGTALVIVVTGAAAMRHLQNQQQNVFSEKLSADKIAALAQSRLMVNMAHEMAQVLHGSMQSRLVATALELKRASAVGDWAAVDRALAEARNILASPPVEVPVTSGTVSDEVARKVALWESLCSISAEIQTQSDFTETPVPRLIGRVVEEALSNAIRHGQASKIHVSVTSDAPTFVTIIVDDNGSGPRPGRAGGGSAFLERVSGGHWSLKAISPGTRLTVVMPTGPS